VVDRSGHVAAASRAGLEALAGAGGEALRDRMEVLARRPASGEGSLPPGVVTLAEAGWLWEA
jgi:hypothetical protein